MILPPTYPLAHDRHAARPEQVVAPQVHEGVGNALRSAYLPRASDLPSDFAWLLEQLH